MHAFWRNVRQQALIVRAFYSQHRVALLREEGLAATLAGDTAAAIDAYGRYLTCWADPDDLGKPQADSVRAELDALLRAKG